MKDNYIQLTVTSPFKNYTFIHLIFFFQNDMVVSLYGTHFIQSFSQGNEVPKDFL